MKQIAPDKGWFFDGRTLRLLIARATLLPLLLLLGSCATAPGSGALDAAERRAAEAEARAVAQAARADQAKQQALEAQAQAQRVEREARQALENQSSLQQLLGEARERAKAAEADSANAQTLAIQFQRDMEAARAVIDELAQRPSPETVVPRDDFEEAQARLAAAEAELATFTSDSTPTYDVTFRGSTELVLDQQVPISVEVSVPTGKPVPEDAVFRDRIEVVSQAVRASLSGSNFEITYDENLIQSMVAGKAVWNFKVKPLMLGAQTLYATVTQYAEGNNGGLPTALRTDSWDVNVVVDPAPQIVTAITRNLGEFAIGIVLFFGGMVAELIRRRLFGPNKKET
jgi:hypothetical protein